MSQHRAPRTSVIAATALAAVVMSLFGVTAAVAAPPPPALVVDDFDDGDTADWSVFGGNAAGGGGGPAADRPHDGDYYLSTGWGGEGTASGFYGGMYKNLANDAQVALPTDPWLSMWVLNQSNATVDEYRLEITVREDTNGDGWVDGTEDSIRYDVTFPSSAFDDQWTLVTSPLSNFVNQNTGGNGVFDGAVDEMVVVVAGVQGGSGSTVEVDFDTIAFTSAPSSAVIDDFANGVAPATACAALAPPLGFCTFNGAGSSVAIATTPTPPSGGPGGDALQMDVDATSYAGFIRGFANSAADTWVTQDWSTREGISFWMYGTGSGTAMFVDILDNRNPGSTIDDAERFSVAFTDDVAGWNLREFPFTSFARKEVGNGAPNDGLGLFAMHGYAIGTLGTGGAKSFYVDDVSVYGVAEPPALVVNFSTTLTHIEEGTTGTVGVKLNRPMGPDDPAEVSIDYATERSNANSGQEFTPTSGTLTFVNGGPSSLTFPVETFDDTKFEGDEQIVIRLTNPVDVERGSLFQGSVLIDDNDPYDPKLLDDFEQGAYLWEGDGLVAFDPAGDRDAIGDSNARPDQDAVETVLTATVPGAADAYDARIQGVVDDLTALLPASSPEATHVITKAIDRLTASLDQENWEDGFFLNAKDGQGTYDRIHQAVQELDKIVKGGGPESAAAQAAIDGLVAGAAAQATDLIDVAEHNGADPNKVAAAKNYLGDAEDQLAAGKADKAVENYRKAWDAASKEIAKLVKAGTTVSVGSIGHDFALGQDWTGTQSLDFWFNGTGSGEPVTVNLKDNRAADPGPDGWTLAWSDEFDGAAGAPPNPANWVYEIGDTTPDGKNGWGNEELQYYTDDPANAATDGDGNLVITLDKADPSLECYYGPCEYESARLLTQNKAEFAYGRIESRLLVPDGGAGLWPAFWSLGTDITHNPWPGSGEIDIMEYVSRLQNEAFGTIHGPGYNGGGSFGGIYDFGEPVHSSYHTFAVEWEPNLITWYVDGIQYHQAQPSDVPGPWVFDKPFFLLLNFAIGGNFGGTPDPANTYPQTYAVDYVRVYQGPDTAERFEASFTDSVTGWQRVSVPITDFVRSANQPTGAPNDGLGLDDVWGYGFALPYPAGGTYQFDLVERTPIPPPTELVVTTLADSGPGSLREALGLIADGGAITFDPSLAGGTITLTSGQLQINRGVTVDASAAAPLTISAGGSSRVLEIGAGVTVGINDVVIRDGVAAPQGGGILNRGSLSLDRVVVTANTENSAGPASFDLGGGGIYNADSSTLNLTDSTVSNNSSAHQPGGGIYGFFNSTVSILRSTVSGNVSGDVAGGMRSLGDTTVVNSTFSGNTSTAWHGGGIFHTDGALTVTSSTFTGNIAPGGTASGILVATFGAPANLTLTNSVMEGFGGAFACAIEGGGAATIASGGHNVISDGSCNPNGTTDQSNTDALLGPLADNGGPTFTHALGAGSPAIDAASAGVATDQRGVARPRGAASDVGAFELIP